MKRKSDLTPPLGFPGGPCHVSDRARTHVNQATFTRIKNELEQRGRLSQSLERTVYPSRHLQRGRGKIDLLLTSHAQYRMDLRGITVPFLSVGFRSFEKWILNIIEKRQVSSKASLKFNQVLKQMQGDGFTWYDPKTNLEFGIKYSRNLPQNTFLISTVYHKKDPDPKAPGRGSCDESFEEIVQRTTPDEPEISDPLLDLLTRRVARQAYQKSVGDLAGVRTFVDEQSYKGISDPNQPSSYNPSDSPKFDGYRALPLPSGHPKSRTKKLPQPAYNTPGSSWKMKSSIVNGNAIKMRTPSTPGEQYGHPYLDQGTTIHKRRSVLASSKLWMT